MKINNIVLISAIGLLIIGVALSYFLRSETSNLKGINNNPTPNISKSQELDNPQVQGITHVVVEGDTVDSLAKKYNSNPQKIVDYPNNRFADDKSFTLIVGETIFIPDGEN